MLYTIIINNYMVWELVWRSQKKQITGNKWVKEHWKIPIYIPSITHKDLKRTITAFLGVVQYVQMNNPELHIIPKTMCQDDVENYFSLQRARVSRGNPTTLQFFNLLLLLKLNFSLLQKWNTCKEIVALMKIMKLISF